MSPIARGNDGKGNDIENFFVVFLVVIPDDLPILHCEVVLIVLVIRMAADCVEQLVTTPGIFNTLLKTGWGGGGGRGIM